MVHKYYFVEFVEWGEATVDFDPLISINLSLKCLWNFLHISPELEIRNGRGKKSLFYWDVTDFLYMTIAYTLSGEGYKI
jgi:hypothetical protein